MWKRPVTSRHEREPVQLLAPKQRELPAQQPAEATTVQHQMQGLFEFEGHVRQPFQSQKVCTAGLRMAAVAEPFKLTLL